MASFFTRVIEFFQIVIETVANVVRSLVEFLLLIPNAMHLPIQLQSFVPAIIGASISTVVLIAVLKLIVGR